MPAAHRTAAILSIGDELTLGQTLDTNSRWLSQRLLDAGVSVREHVTVPDDLALLTSTLERLATAGPNQIDLILITGGLGPTADDLTREAIAAVLHEPLIEDAQAVADLRRWFVGRDMPATNLVQALRPATAMCLPNPHGTAPGLHAALERRMLADFDAGEPGVTIFDPDDESLDIFCLPGPPREMQPMFESHVLPRLRRPANESLAIRVLPTFGLGESEIARRLGPLMDRDRAARNLPLVGTTASNGVVSIRIRAAGEPDAASVAADAVASECRTLVGSEWILADADRSLAAAVLDLLRARGETLALAESCTAGLLASTLGEVPGSSNALWGGFVTYANAAKSSLLGVAESTLAQHGAVSPHTALAMADGALRAAGTHHALAITGIAGPTGGTPEKPVGTVWIGLASRGQSTIARRFLFTGDRQNIRVWSAQSALGLLRLRLIGREDLALLRQREAV